MDQAGYRAAVADAMTEDVLQRRVMELLDSLGWLGYHAPDNRPVVARGGRRYVQNVRAGFPDIVAVRGDRVLYAELKRQGMYLKPDQRTWRDRLVAAGAEWYLWRPADLLGGSIDDVLRRTTR